MNDDFSVLCIFVVNSLLFIGNLLFESISFASISLLTGNFSVNDSKLKGKFSVESLSFVGYFGFVDGVVSNSLVALMTFNCSADS